MTWVTPHRCSNNLSGHTQHHDSQGQSDTFFPRAHKGHVRHFFFLIFPPFKWLAPRPNPLITQPAEGIRSSNFSEGSGWGVHVRATSASHPIRTSSFPKYEPSASTLVGLLWGNWKPKNGFQTVANLLDWHNAVTSKVFSFSKKEISSRLASWGM